MGASDFIRLLINTTLVEKFYNQVEGNKHKIYKTTFGNNKIQILYIK